MNRAVTIKDLPVSHDLDRDAMAAVRGGDQTNASTNSISEVMNVNTIVGNGSTFGGTANFTVNATHTQTASIFNNQLNFGALILDHPNLARLKLLDFFQDR
jgi:hypothetical protein